MKRTFFTAAVCVSVLFAFAGCGKKSETKTGETAVPVKALTVTKSTISEAIEYVGNVVGKEEAVVYPKVTGKVMQKVKEEGSIVKKGDAILYIDRDEIGMKFEKAPVESPLDGVVGRIYVDLGANVTPQTPVAMVSDMSEVEVHLSIPEDYLRRLKAGLKVNIMSGSYPDEVFPGAISKVSPVIDLDTRSAPIEIRVIDKERKLQSGMFVKAALVLTEHKDVPVIIKEAVMGKAPDQYVYVVKDNRAFVRPVRLGLRDGQDIEVKEGLKDGDMVVVMGQQKLRDNASVIVELSENNQ